VPEKEPATQVVKNIRRATRRHFSAEDKIRIVPEGLRGNDSIAELCRREGIVQNLLPLLPLVERLSQGGEEATGCVRCPGAQARSPAKSLLPRRWTGSSSRTRRHRRSEGSRECPLSWDLNVVERVSVADCAAPWVFIFSPDNTEGGCDHADHTERATNGCYAEEGDEAEQG
jgi:transposase-like protein